MCLLAGSGSCCSQPVEDRQTFVAPGNLKVVAFNCPRTSWLPPLLPAVAGFILSPSVSHTPLPLYFISLFTSPLLPLMFGSRHGNLGRLAFLVLFKPWKEPSAMQTALSRMLKPHMLGILGGTISSCEEFSSTSGKVALLKG